MANHTQGPWRVEDPGADNLAVYAGDRRIAGKIPQEDRANASLIAAAPDLLAFARSVDENPPACVVQSRKPAGHSDPFGDCDCWACEMVRAARDAIAKAEAP